jgi:hypothetical protein
MNALEVKAIVNSLTSRLMGAIESLETIGVIARECPELNMSNYSADDVAELNAAMVEVCCVIESWRKAYPEDSKAAQDSLKPEPVSRPDVSC